MHIVHYNTKYGSINNAVREESGLAVLGVFFEVASFIFFSWENKGFISPSKRRENISKKFICLYTYYSV